MKLFRCRLLMPIFLLLPFFVNAQEVDYNKVIPPAAMANEDFAEKLVRISWNNYPANKAVQSNVVIAEQELRLARWSWLDNIAVTGNLNEFTITGGPNEQTRQRALFFPRYNVSVRLSPGMIVQIPAEKRRAKESLNIAQLNVNEQMLLVRKEVLQRYQEYLMSKQLLEMETKMLEGATTEFEIKEERFKRGQIVLDDYNASASAYMSQQRSKLQAETNYIKAKLELEALVGMRLEEVR